MITVVTPPDPIVLVEDMKAHLRVDHDLDDDLIEAMVAAAQGHIDGPDGWLGRAIGKQTLKLTQRGFCIAPRGSILALPLPPIVSVSSVVYDDQTGVEHTVDPASYSVFGDLLSPKAGFSWPSAQAVRITFQAGYDPVPAPIVAAIKLMAADLYENRSSVANAARPAVDMSVTVERLLAPYKIWRV